MTLLESAAAFDSSVREHFESLGGVIEPAWWTGSPWLSGRDYVIDARDFDLSADPHPHSPLAERMREVYERVGIVHVGQLPLEQLLQSKPDVLLVETEHLHAPAMATQILSHPALRDLRDRITVVEIPRPLWSCPGPWMADALDLLAAARASLRTRAGP